MAPADDERHYVTPIDARGDATLAIDRMAALICRLPRTKLIEHSPNYLHAEFRTPILRFCDDVEFMTDAAATPPVLHVRSSSRVGYSDFGLNRNRVEMLRRVFNESFDT